MSSELRLLLDDVLQDREDIKLEVEKGTSLPEKTIKRKTKNEDGKSFEQEVLLPGVFEPDKYFLKRPDGKRFEISYNSNGGFNATNDTKAGHVALHAKMLSRLVEYVVAFKGD